MSARAVRRLHSHDDYHPLEVVPFFRRFRPSVARDILYTFIWNCALGLVFWGIGIVFGARVSRLEYLGWNLIVANSIGYTIHALFMMGAAAGLEGWTRRTGIVAKTLYYTLVSTAGVVIGFAIVAAFLDERMFYNWFKNPRFVAIMAFTCLVLSVVLSVVFFVREREARAQAALEKERSRAERVEREAALANLRALQAQIEPHFLFNTLANVASLIDADPAQSKRMLERFIGFLRASLAATRAESTTLGAEGELIAAYLEVLQVRMGSRLRYAIDVEPELKDFALPPMLLQPVVENAIRHGLEPNVAGGEVRFSARREGAHVVVEIADTGIGFAPATAGGVGLANLRARLRLLYGERAALTLTEGAGGGTVVRMRLPA